MTKTVALEDAMPTTENGSAAMCSSFCGEVMSGAGSGSATGGGGGVTPPPPPLPALVGGGPPLLQTVWLIVACVAEVSTPVLFLALTLIVYGVSQLRPVEAHDVPEIHPEVVLLEVFSA